MRLHGTGRVCLPDRASYDDVTARHPRHPSARAVVIVDVERISYSCGHGAPVMDLTEERDLLRLHAGKKGLDGIARRTASSPRVRPASRTAIGDTAVCASLQAVV